MLLKTGGTLTSKRSKHWGSSLKWGRLHCTGNACSKFSAMALLLCV